jgi:hypothetical protein
VSHIKHSCQQLVPWTLRFKQVAPASCDDSAAGAIWKSMQAARAARDQL